AALRADLRVPRLQVGDLLVVCAALGEVQPAQHRRRDEEQRGQAGEQRYRDAALRLRRAVVGDAGVGRAVSGRAGHRVHHRRAGTSTASPAGNPAPPGPAVAHRTRGTRPPAGWVGTTWCSSSRGGWDNRQQMPNDWQATEIGMARPMPSAPLALAAATPTTCFSAFTTGPPELP